LYDLEIRGDSRWCGHFGTVFHEGIFVMYEYK
jgi:hypothetical protein